MGTRKLHLHSMMVHAIAAFAPSAAVAYIFYALDISFYRFNHSTWSFLMIFSLIMMFLISLPSIMTGVFERGHIYAKWHSTHKIKLILSLALALFLIIEFILLAQKGSLDNAAIVSPLGVFIILLNNIVTFFLCVYGLKISLGRQSLAKTSYVPDLFKSEPVDILLTAAQNRKEQPKFIDILQER